MPTGATSSAGSIRAMSRVAVFMLLSRHSGTEPAAPCVPCAADIATSEPSVKPSKVKIGISGNSPFRGEIGVVFSPVGKGSRKHELADGPVDIGILRAIGHHVKVYRRVERRRVGGLPAQCIGNIDAGTSEPDPVENDRQNEN